MMVEEYSPCGSDIKRNLFSFCYNLDERLSNCMTNCKFIEYIRVALCEICNNKGIIYNVLNHLACDDPGLVDIISSNCVVSAFYRCWTNDMFG